MQVPLQVVFRNMEHDPAIEADVRRRADKLEEFSSRITSCTVTVEVPHQHHRQGNLFKVKIHLAVPRHRDIVVDQENDGNHAYEDVRVAIRDAFKAARRQLQDAVREDAEAVRVHSFPAHGKVSQFIPEEGYGFIQRSDGLEIYFQENSLVNVRLEDLTIGTAVEFDQAEGERGLQARNIHLFRGD
jgi:cold shock CspA family protein/ribosome-associated translation inhibitor RaiA